MNTINLSYVPEWYGKNVHLNETEMIGCRAKEAVEDEWLGPLIEQIMNFNAKENKSEDFFDYQRNLNNNDS